MSVEVLDFHHASLLVADTQRSLDFYQGILGLQLLDSRPPLNFPGAWLALGRYQIHLMELPNPDAAAERPAHGGRDRHLALTVRDFEQLRQTLDQAGIDYSCSQSGRKALFCRDPDGNTLEFVPADA